MNNRKILITCLVLLLILCLLISCIGAVGTGFYFWTSNNIETSQEDNYSNPLKNDLTPDNPETDSSNSPSQGGIDPDVAVQMDEIQVQVIMERGLKPSDSVDRNLYTQDELRAKIIQDFTDELSPEETLNDQITLAAFGLLDPDFDLYNFYIDLLSEQVAGFYDQDTKEMAIIQAEKFGGAERITYAHEYTHALQDQNYDIENGLNYNDEACDLDSERCAAIQALLEGDATLSQMRWFMAYGTIKDRADLMEMYTDLDMEVFDSAPEFITLDFMFPYEQGYTFVESLYNKGGWGTVDRAYQDLPQSTEQILHPERYPGDIPIPHSLPDFTDDLGSGWQEIDRGTMGEWYTYLILAKGLDENGRIDEDQASLAADGWGGDAYIVYFNPESQETLMVLQTIWDTKLDADEFASSFQNYAQNRFGNSSGDSWQGADGLHSLNQKDDTTTWILAPNEGTLTTVWNILEP